jgi:hypothetical protein
MKKVEIKKLTAYVIPLGIYRRSVFTGSYTSGKAEN